MYVCINDTKIHVHCEYIPVRSNHHPLFKMSKPIKQTQPVDKVGYIIIHMYKHTFTHIHPYSYKYTYTCTYTCMYARTHIYI